MATTVATTRHISVRGGTLTTGEQSLEIGAEPLVVGRDASANLVLSDPRVSALHAELVATPRGVRVRDLGSKNGIWYEGLRITEGLLVEPATLFFGPVEVAFAPAEDAERFSLALGERFHGLYGRSAPMRELFARLERAAGTDLTVLIEGETGTGKELVAKAVHEASARRKGPFVVVDCGAIPENLAEAALFGHARGAFTGATGDRMSPFVEADGGTIFLDELGELPIDLQPKLLRALAERRVKAVGGKDYVPFDVRIVAATRRDLSRAVNEGGFRSDLFFRVAQVRVTTPPLRDRSEDIPGLVRCFLEAQKGGSAVFRRITRDSMTRLLRHDWPGNVRELRNAVEVAVALADEGPIDVSAHIGALGSSRPSERGTAPVGLEDGELGYHDAKRAALDRFEKAYFASLLERAGGNIAEISRRAGLQRTHVRKYLVTHGLWKKG